MTWIDRLAPKALAVVGAGTCATNGGIHAMAGNPTGAMGLQDYLGRNWKSKAGLPIVNVPGCPVQPDNFMETLLYLAVPSGGTRADDSAGSMKIGRNGCSERPYTMAATAGVITSRANSRTHMASSECLVKMGCWGPVVNCNVPKRGWMAGIGGCPNVGRHLHRMHHAGFSGQVHAVHG